MQCHYTRLSAGLCTLIALVACKSKPASHSNSLDDRGNPTLPIVNFLSADGNQTVTFVGMVHIAPAKFYQDIVDKITPDIQRSNKTAGLLEGIKCSKSWFDIQQIINSFSLKKDDLTARFSEDDLAAAASGSPSQAIVDYITEYVKSWIDQNNPKEMITQELCAAHEASGASLSQYYDDYSSKLKSESGKDWVYQNAKDSPFQKFLSSPNLGSETTDIDNSDLDMSNPSHLLYYFFVSQHDQSLKFPLDPKGVGPWEVVFGVGSVAGLSLRGAYPFEMLSKISTTFFNHVVMPWGAGHLSDFRSRFAAAGYQEIGHEEIVYDEHCSESQGLEKSLCDTVGE